MPAPSRESFLGFAQAFAEAQWEVLYGQPMRARETARAWVGVIELMVMGSSRGYAQASSTPYQPPQTTVVPAAPGITLTELGFSVTYLEAGSPLRFDQGHVEKVTSLFDALVISQVPTEQYTRETRFPEDRVLITWSTQCAPLFDDGKYPVPFNVFLLTPDGKEQETSRVTTRIVAAFPSEEDATVWVQTRSAQLKSEHDRNHACQCRDKTCKEREHLYVRRDDD